MIEVTPGNEPTSTNLGTTSATFHEEVARDTIERYNDNHLYMNDEEPIRLTGEFSYWVTVKVTTTAHIPVLVKVTGTQDPINMITLGDVEECLPNGSYRLADWEIIATAPAN